MQLTGVPDYDWYSGCFGTACGNLIGFWDRHGLPDYYRGPTAGGVAPLDSFGSNSGIYSLWASKAGRDGRPQNQPGHEDDYYVAYESTLPDPHVTLGRAEHSPDCIGDFIGLNQNKWHNMNGECDGNLDGYTFVYWDATGNRRTNFTPGDAAGSPPIDMQSGLRAWSQYCGYDADVFTQLADVYPPIAETGAGFTFADLRREIDAGYPVLIFLQEPGRNSRHVGSMARANPSIHGMLAIGYYVDDFMGQKVLLRTSWATGPNYYQPWTGDPWEGMPSPLAIRGVIGFHPKPKITAFRPRDGQLTLRWDGPDAEVYDAVAQTTRPAHWYVVESASSLLPGDFRAVSEASPAREVTLSNCCPGTAFYRVKLVNPPGL